MHESGMGGPDQKKGSSKRGEHLCLSALPGLGSCSTHVPIMRCMEGLSIAVAESPGFYYYESRVRAIIQFTVELEQKDLPFGS